ncbi:MAG: hypothetical protein A3I89_00920 [Candidatus Harrisonbacteria bacterium RIFCSPLOWO2_02_FULL_41_11]|nr:MAG: hypothetical protein A3I89_00920 [Candidatus Harrisonbacteria bacterium RIFCSPLOWO2_02_FULL_41_11]
MKDLIKKIIIFKLDILAKLYIWRFKPEIIAVTGNVGKTSTKEAVALVLAKVKTIRYGRGNLNNEFGVPLTILGDWSDDYYGAVNIIFFWCKVICISLIKLFTEKSYPKIIVLEFGADRPGDIGRLARKYKPRIGVITAVGDIPVHVEYFSGPEAVAREKSKLISGLGVKDYAIINHDDPAVFDMRAKTKAKTMSYGFSEGSTVRLSDLSLRLDENLKPAGIGFKVNYGPHTFVPFTIEGSLGKSQALAVGAATCIGWIYRMNLIEISQALEGYHGPKGRLRLIGGIKNSVIIDDTYNSSPSSARLALDTIKDIDTLRQAQGKITRKLVILGDMLELGKYTEKAHREIGNLAGSIADILVTVGARAKFIADSASNQMLARNIYSFETSDMAKEKVLELVEDLSVGETGEDLILVKGSQGMRMEKIVEKIMAEPRQKKELLVRQNKKWQAT